MLLDLQAIKTALLGLPAEYADAASRGGASKVPPAAAYQRYVNKTIGRFEATLKAVMAPAEPGEAFVDHFLALFAAPSHEAFHTVMELKVLPAAPGLDEHTRAYRVVSACRA